MKLKRSWVNLLAEEVSASAEYCSTFLCVCRPLQACHLSFKRHQAWKLPEHSNGFISMWVWCYLAVWWISASKMLSQYMQFWPALDNEDVQWWWQTHFYFSQTSFFAHKIRTAFFGLYFNNCQLIFFLWQHFTKIVERVNIDAFFPGRTSKSPQWDIRTLSFCCFECWS